MSSIDRMDTSLLNESFEGVIDGTFYMELLLNVHYHWKQTIVIARYILL